MPNTENHKRISLDELLMKRLRAKYGVSKRYINMSITGDRESETADKIKTDFEKVLNSAQKAISTI